MTAENLLEVGGYKLSSGEGSWVHFTTKNSYKGTEMGFRKVILCGPVLNSKTKMKETEISPEEYRNLLFEDMKLKSENKISNEDLLSTLAESSITTTLLQVKSSQAVSLNLNPDPTGRRETGSKRGVFLQYNASRLAGIRKKHRQLVQDGVYSEVPQHVDFSSLKEPEEWALLFNFLLEYPTMIERLADEMAAGKSSIHKICDFLSKLCSLFSVYYRRVRILLEPRAHLFPTIHARFLLARSVEQVLHNGLAILNIKTVEQM